ncbi:hypothetical protein M0722_16095 [Microbacterium sp. KSW4-16]|uniref:Uncharacterized protein n=1 Tax=Microbacterium aurugineum TaxID=2851642 RepID=A0ABY4IVB0_9MICO|nr:MULTISPECIES: hypothetical protein [Microbacterium]MCK8468719.1 hypothetical protein [Microbacterium aurugineum]MCZ4301992.1 hypothetical protein [Microbacterium oxydans]UPL16695.1 hypothetical protein KV397_02435 [Microbacterium aurugineum]
MMTRTITQRLTIILPLIGVAFLLASMLLPVQLAAAAWGVAMTSFLIALATAIAVQRHQGQANVTSRELAPSNARPMTLRVGVATDDATP